jgi:hypothetical protein
MEEEEDAKANDTDDYQIQLGRAFHGIEGASFESRLSKSFNQSLGSA